MTVEDLFTLALRVLGFWVLVSAFGSTAHVVAMITTSDVARTEIVVQVGVTAFTSATLAAILLLYAPSVASCFYHRQPGETGVSRLLPIGVRDLYQIAARMLGMFSFFSAIKPASIITSELFASRFWENFYAGSWHWAFHVQASAYVICGALLVLWAPKLASLFASAHDRTKGSGVD